MARLDNELTKQNLCRSRSQAADLIRRGKVKVDGRIITKPSWRVEATNKLTVVQDETYVSRAALKLQSAAQRFDVDFSGATALDVGISTGGFTEYMLSRGAKRVVGVEIGTNQLDQSLRGDPRIELHEKTDIRDYKKPAGVTFDFVTIDVSFISMREVLPTVLRLANKNTKIIAMLKPQFESGKGKKHKGVIKNDTMRRKILKDFELWLKPHALILDKADSEVSGKKGNVERFYLLKKVVK